MVTGVGRESLTDFHDSLFSASFSRILSPDLFEFPADILVAARQRLVLLSEDLIQIQLVNFHGSRSFLGSIDRLLPSEERLRHKCVSRLTSIGTLSL